MVNDEKEKAPVRAAGFHFWGLFHFSLLFSSSWSLETTNKSESVRAKASSERWGKGQCDPQLQHCKIVLFVPAARRLQLCFFVTTFMKSELLFFERLW